MGTCCLLWLPEAQGSDPSQQGSWLAQGRHLRLAVWAWPWMLTSFFSRKGQKFPIASVPVSRWQFCRSAVLDRNPANTLQYWLFNSQNYVKILRRIWLGFFLSSPWDAMASVPQKCQRSESGNCHLSKYIQTVLFSHHCAVHVGSKWAAKSQSKHSGSAGWRLMTLIYLLPP